MYSYPMSNNDNNITSSVSTPKVKGKRGPKAGSKRGPRKSPIQQAMTMALVSIEKTETRRNKILNRIDAFRLKIEALRKTEASLDPILIALTKNYESLMAMAEHLKA